LPPNSIVADPSWTMTISSSAASATDSGARLHVDALDECAAAPAERRARPGRDGDRGQRAAFHRLAVGEHHRHGDARQLARAAGHLVLIDHRWLRSAHGGPVERSRAETKADRKRTRRTRARGSVMRVNQYETPAARSPIDGLLNAGTVVVRTLRAYDTRHAQPRQTDTWRRRRRPRVGRALRATGLRNRRRVRRQVVDRIRQRSDNSRYFPSRRSTASNVARLQVAWTYPYGETGSSPDRRATA
jgi:hypothetical protein